MQLTPFCLVLSCLRVTPDRTQFSRYDLISLSCEDKLDNSTGWKVKRNTSAGGVRPCSSSWGSVSSDATCIIGNAYSPDSGVYWCESEDGEKSNAVNITITELTVILESPALPVVEGAAVTLRCKAVMKLSGRRFTFYKDGRAIASSSTGEMTIHSASKSDEGLYKCALSGEEESMESWLAVEASLPLTPSASAPSALCHSLPVSRLICHLVVGTPYLLSTILLGLIYRDRRRAAEMVAERRASNNVIMEIAA